jgi:hypothetical protein
MDDMPYERGLRSQAALESSPAKRVSSKGIISLLEISTDESALKQACPKLVPRASVEEESNCMKRVTPGWIKGAS